MVVEEKTSALQAALRTSREFDLAKVEETFHMTRKAWFLAVSRAAGPEGEMAAQCATTVNRTGLTTMLSRLCGWSRRRKVIS